jgi:hypothetical protein
MLNNSGLWFKAVKFLLATQRRFETKPSTNKAPHN